VNRDQPPVHPEAEASRANKPHLDLTWIKRQTSPSCVNHTAILWAKYENPNGAFMTDQFTRQVQEILTAAKDARIPENVKALAEDSVAKTRDAYSKMSSAARDGAKIFENVMISAQAGANSIGETVLRNAETNTEAVFDAAHAISRAGTLPEIVRLQTSFVQKQLAAASTQTKELFELSMKVTQQTFAPLNSAATKAFDQFKRTG
jgi:phasin